MNLKDITISTPEYTSLNFKLAGLGSRSTAMLIDIFMLSMTQLAFSFLILRGLSFLEITSSYVIAVFSILSFFLWWGYFTLFEYFSAGKTLGKMMMNIRVIQDNGQNITFLSALIRNLLRVIDFLPFLYLAGILLIFFHPKHKRLGDIVSGTIVIHSIRNRKKPKWLKSMEHTLAIRGIDLSLIAPLDDFTKRKIGEHEWRILKTYLIRRLTLAPKERDRMTQKVSRILLPLTGVDPETKSIIEQENQLFILYYQIKGDWDYSF